jgi:chromosome segregation ATPase
MEILEQLDAQVTNLLERIHTLRAENEGLRTELESLKETITALEEKTQSLTDALDQEKAVRMKALEQINTLIQKIQDFDSKKYQSTV